MFFEYNPAATLDGHACLTERAQALRQSLLPLRSYVQHRIAKLDITSPYAQAVVQHIKELEAMFRALAEYDSAVQELVTVHLPREQQARTQRQQLEREADPVYRLGFMRGYRRGQTISQQAHERVLSLYAQYAILVPPPGHTPSPVAARMQRFLGELTERYGPLNGSSTTQQVA